MHAFLYRLGYESKNACFFFGHDPYYYVYANLFNSRTNCRKKKLIAYLDLPCKYVYLHISTACTILYFLSYSSNNSQKLDSPATPLFIIIIIRLLLLFLLLTLTHGSCFRDSCLNGGEVVEEGKSIHSFMVCQCGTTMNTILTVYSHHKLCLLRHGKKIRFFQALLCWNGGMPWFDISTRLAWLSCSNIVLACVIALLLPTTA